MTKQWKFRTACLLTPLAGALLFFACTGPRLLPDHTITNLYDAFGNNPSLQKDFGFSCILRHEGRTILFDAGSNADIFRNNVKQMGIDLKKLDAIVISHGHFDHLNGIDYVLKINPKVKIYMPYDVFWGAPVPFDATGQDTTVQQDLPPQLRYFDGGSTRFVIQQSGRFWGADVEYIKSSRKYFPDARL
ncbi:MAG: MBL fold metallo-hydrolase [Lewinellaceae bacterium]|nr:MBL fold metallo-hydrolase [Lewinellaceae bacterium]